jgi:hypothetical protein
MRKLGVGIAGLVGGLLVGFLVVEIIIRTAVDDPSQLADSLPLALLVGFTTPMLAIVGVLVALGINNRSRRQDASSSSRPTRSPR